MNLLPKIIVCLFGCVLTIDCPAGQKPIANPANKKCYIDAPAGKTACNSLSCCVKDSSVCKSNSVSCASTHYLDATKAKNNIGTDKKAACCTARATCKDLSACTAGRKKKANSDATKCASTVKTCESLTCCELDKDKCGGVNVICPSGEYKDKNKYSNDKGTDPKKACCSPKPTCANFDCTKDSLGASRKGWHQKDKDSKKTYDGNDRGDGINQCCEVIENSCLYHGMKGVTCPTDQVFDAAKIDTVETGDTKAKQATCCKAATQESCSAWAKLGRGVSATSGTVRVSGSAARWMAMMAMLAMLVMMLE